MTKKLVVVSSIIIYLIYAYLFLWQGYFFGQEMFNRIGEKNGEGAVYKLLPAFVLFLFGVLLLGNIILKQRKMLIFNCTSAASMLFVYATVPASIMGTLVLLFGMVSAGFEMRRND